MVTFKQFINENSQEYINKLLKKLETLNDEKEIVLLKGKIELLQDKLSKK